MLQECLLNDQACPEIQHGFSKLSLVNLISKDMNLVFYSSVHKLVHSDKPPDSTSILEALPGKRDIKRPEHGILFLSVYNWVHSEN